MEEGNFGFATVWQVILLQCNADVYYGIPLLCCIILLYF